MTDLAIIFMVTAVTAVTVLVSWCYYQVLTRDRKSNNDEAHTANEDAGR